jgi:hypothetical protein
MPGVTKPAGATRWKGEGTIWVILVQGAEKGRDRRIVCEMLIQKPRDPTAVEKNCAGMARLLFMRDNLSSLPPHVRDSTYIQLSAWAAGLDDRAWYEEQAKMLIEQRNENGPVPTAIDSTGPAAAPMATATATLTMRRHYRPRRWQNVSMKFERHSSSRSRRPKRGLPLPLLQSRIWPHRRSRCVV